MEKQSYIQDGPASAQFFSHLPQQASSFSPQSFTTNPDSPEMSSLTPVQGNRTALNSGFDPNFSINYDEILCMSQARGSPYISASPSFITSDLSRSNYTSGFQRLPPINSEPADSESEMKKLLMKREKNRLAAAKCRNRRREQLEELEKQVKQMEGEADMKEQMIVALRRDKQSLIELIEKHNIKCSTKIDLSEVEEP